LHTRNNLNSRDRGAAKSAGPVAIDAFVTIVNLALIEGSQYSRIGCSHEAFGALKVTNLANKFY